MAPEVCSLVDHHFVLEDGLRKEFRGNYETSRDVSLEQISRLLIERGDYPAVPINFEYPCGLVTGWPQWVDHELKDEATRIRLSEAAVLSSVFISARCDINRDVESLRHLVRRWNPHTHTFVCEWGEFTPTLEDVLNIMRLPITGSVNPLGFDFDSEKLQVLVEGASSVKGSKRRFSNWVKHFWGVTENRVFVPGKGFNSGCRLEAMLCLWLTKFVFIEFSYEYVEERLFPLAIAIAAGSRFSLGPMFLGHVYRLLDYIVVDELESVGRCGVTTLVSTTFLQVFIWERFKGLNVEPLTMSLSLELYNNDKEGSKQAQTEYLPPVLPLLCRWFKRRQDKTVFAPSMLDNVNNFIWQPYLQPSEFETFSFSGREEQCATAPGRVELYMTVCPSFIPSISEDKEDLDIFPVVYSPDRVMRQLGCLQDVPSPPPRSLNSKITSFSHMERRCVLDFSGRIADFPSQLPGNAANANASPAYSCYWRGVLCRFRLFVEAGSPQLELGPITSSRLASSKAVLTYAEKHNLTYTEVYSDGTRKIVGYLKGFETKKAKGEGKKCDKKMGDKGDAKEHNVQKPIRRFKPKVDFDKFMHTTQHGVRLLIPPSMLLQKDKEVKKKRSSTSRASGTSPARQVNATSSEVKKRVKREAGVDFDVLLRRRNRVKSMSSPSPRGPPAYVELSESDHGEGSQGGPTDSPKEDHTNLLKEVSDHLPAVPPIINQDRSDQVIEDEGMSDGDKVGEDKSMSDGGKVVEDEGMSDGDKVVEDEGMSDGDNQAFEDGSVSNDDQVDAEFEPLQHGPSESENNDQEQDHPSDVGKSNDRVGHDTAVPDKHVPGIDKVTIVQTQSLGPSLPAKGSTSEWAIHMDNFMIRFASKEESALGMADVAPVLSGNTAVFAGMKIPSELADPLARFAERYSGGNILSLIDRDYTSRKKCELIKELGMMLYSMEICRIKDGEVFLIWRDACRDFMGAGLNVGFLLDSLKQGAKHFFGYMMRSEGSEDKYVKIRGLQEMVSQTKKELARLERELRKAQDDLSFNLHDVPVSAMECVLESSWKDDSHFSHYLY